MFRFPLITCCLLVLLASVYSSTASAHFVWLDSQTSGDASHAIMFFGEGTYDRNYHMPEAIAKAEVSYQGEDGKKKQLDMMLREEDDFYGLKGEVPNGQNFLLETSCQYGVYHGSLLTYYARHIAQSDWEKLPEFSDHPLAIAPQSTDDGVEFTVTWKGEPLADAKLTLIDSEDQLRELTTDNQGKAKYDQRLDQVSGTFVNHMVADDAGELEGEEYKNSMNVATITFRQTEAKATSDKSAESKNNPTLTPLPEAVASFGAAVCNGWLYVYSGHTGTEHEHSEENLSQHFRRLKIDGGSDWEELPMQNPLQGLPLVAHDGKLYRVGGMSARNAPDEDEDLHSVDEFASYDPAKREWTSLAPLPEPRSSHDAVVIGDQLFVAGGWELSGSSGGQWHPSGWSFDLTDPQSQWEPIASPPFSRRALALAHHQGKLVVLCGMDENHEISREVHALDLATGEWSELAEFPGKGRMAGFGISAWTLKGQLYASGSEGTVYRLNEEGTDWQKIAKLDTRRFFHRLVGGEENRLFVVGGASLGDGHLKSIEVIELE